MNELQLLDSLGVTYYNFDGKLDAEKSEDFIQQFKNICSCSKARDLHTIVYVWYTERSIPRMRGESNIVYIGQTERSFHDRHFRYAETEGTGGNWSRYEHIIKNFGPIRISCAVVENPRDSEKTMLRLYFDEHLELPPVNASG